MSQLPTRPLRVAIIGAGPAGIYAGNILKNSVQQAGGTVTIDLLEALPAPYGLIRYGVAPDHPRIKGIVNSLHEMLDSGAIRLIGNVTVGRDISIDELRERYDAVIAATGATRDAPLDIPGIDRRGSYGAADFVSWYDGHPDVAREWPLNAREVAVIGNGNVALDVARVLAKHSEDLRSTDVPDNVLEGLEASPVTDVHVFGRRGPAEVKFTPIELRELGEVSDVDLIVYDDDFAREDEIAASGVVPAGRNNQVKIMLRTLNAWRTRETGGASRRLHLHFHHAPVSIDADADGAVESMRFERTEFDDDGRIAGTGEFVEYPLQAVYRAVGYFGTVLPGVPFDELRGVIPNDGGRVLDESGASLPGVYATGWIKRGPVGLIGHTKGDALETIENLVTDAAAGVLRAPAVSAPDALLSLLEERSVEYTNWGGWLALDAHERELGATHAHSRERLKVVPRDEQVRVSREGVFTSSDEQSLNAGRLAFDESQPNG